MGGQRGWKRRREYKKGENENDDTMQILDDI